MGLVELDCLINPLIMDFAVTRGPCTGTITEFPRQFNFLSKLFFSEDRQCVFPIPALSDLTTRTYELNKFLARTMNAALTFKHTTYFSGSTSDDNIP